MTKQDEFEKAIQYNKIDTFKKLLNDSEVNPAIDNNWCIWAAVSENSLEVFNILFNDERIDPSADNNSCIYEAVKTNNIEILKKLLTDKRTNPSDPYALSHAAKNGFFDIAEFLLKDKRVDPSSKNNHAIRKAFQYLQHDIINLLWNDNRVKKTLKKDSLGLYNKLIKKDVKNKLKEF